MQVCSLVSLFFLLLLFVADFFYVAIVTLVQHKCIKKFTERERKQKCYGITLP